MTTDDQKEKLRKLATMLRVPRLHFQYIEKHGVDELVDFCEDNVKIEKSVQAAEETKQMKVHLRSEFA